MRSDAQVVTLIVRRVGREFSAKQMLRAG